MKFYKLRYAPTDSSLVLIGIPSAVEPMVLMLFNAESGIHVWSIVNTEEYISKTLVEMS